MRILLLITPILLFSLWIYIAIQFFKGLHKIMKVSGKSFFSFFDGVSYRQMLLDRESNTELKKTMDEEKRKFRKLFILWAISTITLMTVIGIIGRLTMNLK
jgi:hypothetical protein